MVRKTCATPKGRALVGVLSFLFIGVASTNISYAYTVDDLRVFVGEDRKDTLQHKAELNTIIYRYGEQVKNQAIIDSINSNDLGDNLIERYETAVADLTELNGEIDEALESKSAMEVIAMYREADTLAREVKKYNLSDIYYRSSGGTLTESDYEYAKSELAKSEEVYQIGDIGRDLLDGIRHGELVVKQPYGDIYDGTIENNVLHSNGLYIGVSSNEKEVKNLWDGIVEKVVDSDDWGKYVIIRHGGSLTSSISFLSEVYVSEGQDVKQYQPLGKADGDRIYLEIMLDDRYIDPIKVLGVNAKNAYFKWAAANTEKIVEYNDYDNVVDSIETFQDEDVSRDKTDKKNQVTVKEIR